MKVKALISSLIVIVLCFGIITGSTVAIFTGGNAADISVKGGRVDIQASVNKESLKIYSGTVQQLGRNADGALLFANNGTASFDEDSELILDNVTPGDKAVFNIDVINNSSIVLLYRVKWHVTGELADVLASTVDGKDIVNGTSEWAEWDYTNGNEYSIEVTVEMPMSVGNDYQDETATITYTVEAVQANGLTWGNYADTSWYDESPEAAEYTLTTAEELAGFARLVNMGVDFIGRTVKLGASVDLKHTEWIPIGNSGVPFKGTFDGMNHTVSNLSITESTALCVGLFGMTSSGEIKNVTVNNAVIATEAHFDTETNTFVGTKLGTGVVIGQPSTSTCSNITVTGHVTVEADLYAGAVFGKEVCADVTNITVNVDGDSYVKVSSTEGNTSVGGVMGYMSEGNHTVANVTSNIDVYGSGASVGGVVGMANYGNTFVNCVCTGNVYLTEYEQDEDVSKVGGIAGVWYNHDNTDVTFRGCSFSGSISATKTTGEACDASEFDDQQIVGAAYSADMTGTLVIE